MNEYRRALQSSAHSTKISDYLYSFRQCVLYIGIGIHGYENVAIGDCWQKIKIIYHVGRASSAFCSGVVVDSYILLNITSI